VYIGLECARFTNRDSQGNPHVYCVFERERERRALLSVGLYVSLSLSLLLCV